MIVVFQFLSCVANFYGQLAMILLIETGLLLQ
jgi:hypothetical protein